MNHQGDLFDSVQAQAARDDALARVEAHAPANFMETALAVIRQIALRQQRLTTDDVWQRFRVLVAQPHERRAMGAAMVRAQTLGYIKPTKEIENSVMVACHRRPKRVWQSLVQRG